MVIMAGKTKRTPQQIGRASRQKGARFELKSRIIFKLMVTRTLTAQRSTAEKQEMQEMWKVSADYM